MIDTTEHVAIRALDYVSSDEDAQENIIDQMVALGAEWIANEYALVIAEQRAAHEIAASNPRRRSCFDLFETYRFGLMAAECEVLD